MIRGWVGENKLNLEFGNEEESCMRREKEKIFNSRLKSLIFISIFSISIFLLPLFTFSASDEPLALPMFSKPPKIDGVIESPLWEKEALKIEDFFQLVPTEMAEPTYKTVAYIGYDSKNIYFAFRCYDSDPKKIRATITNRDGCIEDDWIIVLLDTFNEKRRAFGFIINPLGIQIDFIRTEEGGSENMDFSWDTVFSSNGKLDSEGYTVEMAIPFKSLRFPDEKERVWGVNFGRNIARSGEIDIWPEFTRKIPGLLSQAKEISFGGKIEKGGNLEIMPVATSLGTHEKKFNFRPGLNLKYGVSSSMTLDATINPDFSHIEADAPRVDVNRRFALYYAEKRPFFLEGMEIFRFPSINMVYTRRIIEPIVGAKATGKVGSFTYGFLSAYDISPTESLWDISTGGESGDQKALFNIFRVKTDVFKESYIGFCIADKEIDHSYNRVAGIDGTLKFNNKYFFNFQAIASKTKYGDDKTGIAPALFAEAFYFSKHWIFGGYWLSMHPDFIAASGFVNRVDYHTYGGFTSFSIFPEKKFLNSIRLNLRAGQRHDYSWDNVEDRWVSGNIYFDINQWSGLNINYVGSMERYGEDDFKKNEYSINANTNLIGWLPMRFFFGMGDSIYYDLDDPFLGWTRSFGFSLNFKPGKKLQMSVEFSRYNFFQEKGGDRLINFNVIRQVTRYQFSKTLSVRGILDYDFYDKEAYGSFLFSWILRPGTVFFLGLDSNYLRNQIGDFERQGYSIYLKFSYWWRV